MPCINGAHGMAIIRLPDSVIDRTSGATSSAVCGTRWPRNGNPDRRNSPTCDGHVVHHALAACRWCRRCRACRCRPRCGRCAPSADGRRARLRTARHRTCAPATWPVPPSSTSISSLSLGSRCDDPGDSIAERRVEHQGLGVGVVEQVPQLVVEVAVVDVDRHAAHLERSVLRLEVLVAVVQVQPDLGVVARARPPCTPRRGARHARRTAPSCASCRRARLAVSAGIVSAIDSQMRGVVQLHGGERR